MQNLPRTPNLGVLGKVLSEFFIVGKWLKSAASSIGLTIDDGICFEEFRVADSFNDFFTTIASKDLPSGTCKFTSSFFTNVYKSKGIVLVIV